MDATHDRKRAEKLSQVRTFEELLEVALWEIRTCGFDTIVFFPIHTGGLGNVQRNTKRALRLTRHLEQNGHKVWSQIPYLNENLSITPAMTDLGLKFEKFYLALIRCGVFRHHVMMPDWETSYGCRTEHDEAAAIGASILYIDTSWEK